MKPKIKLYQILFFILSFQFVNSQATGVKDSLVDINGEIFQANYEYYIAKADTLYHGPFSLTRQIDAEEENEVFDFTAVNGEFNRNKPHGKWSMRKGVFTPTGKGAFNDYAYEFKINGSEFLATGNFKNGIKDSPWTIYEWEITNSSKKDTLLKAELPFKNNNLTGKFEIQHLGEYLSGFVNAKGLTDNKWSFYETQPNGERVLLKEWVFSNNKLVSKILYSDGQAQRIDINTALNVETVLEEIPFNENYLKIIDMKASVNNPELFQKYDDEKRIRDIFFVVMDNLNDLSSTFTAVNGDLSISPTITTLIERYPLTQTEIDLLDVTYRNTIKADSIIASINENPQINLARISTEEVAYFTSALNAINANYLKTNKKIVDNYKIGNLEYVNRNRFIRANINTNPAIEVESVFEGDTIRSTYQMSYLQINRLKDPLEQLNTLSENLLTEINHLRNNIGTYLKEIQHEEDLLQLEGSLIKKHEEVKRINDSLIDYRHQSLAGFNVNQVINRFADKVLKDFSNLPTAQEKASRVEASLNCLNQLESMVHTIDKTPENMKLVSDAYTNRVFNPYTFTVMEEKVKEPIYDSFTDIILPGIFDNLNKLSCDNISAYKTNFEKVFEEMIGVLKRNTRREENRIRRTNSPSKAAEILNLNLTF